ARATVNRRRRRTGLGARTDRPLRRGAALLGARPQARDARRAQGLSPRHDRALPRPRRAGPALVPPRARPESALLAPVGAGRAEVRVVRKLVTTLVLAGLAALAALVVPAAAFAHPLGNFTINRFSRLETSG